MKYIRVCDGRHIREELGSASFWRDVLAEFFATCLLLAAQCTLPLSWGDPGLGTPVQTALGMGFVVAVLAWALGDFGGAHMNPAVTFAMVLGLEITFTRGLFYLFAQMAGAMAGAMFIKMITPEDVQESLAATALGPGVSPWQGVLTEMWITMVLVIAIYGSTNNFRKPRGLFVPPLIIGLAVTVGILCTWKHTGGSMNPARSFGPALVKSKWKDHWVYWAGPMLGGAVGTLVYKGIFDQIGRHHSKKPKLTNNNGYQPADEKSLVDIA